MSTLLVRIVSGVVAAAILLAVVAHPPENATQALGAVLPALMLLAVAVRGTRRSAISRKKSPPPEPR